MNIHQSILRSFCCEESRDRLSEIQWSIKNIYIYIMTIFARFWGDRRGGAHDWTRFPEPGPERRVQCEDDRIKASRRRIRTPSSGFRFPSCSETGDGQCGILLEREPDLSPAQWAGVIYDGSAADVSAPWNEGLKIERHWLPTLTDTPYTLDHPEK